MSPVRGVFTTHSAAETVALATRLGAELASGDVIALVGELGAGKTTFVRGLVAGLGGEADSVVSPTFTLIQSYQGRLRLHHVDLYRLGVAEAADLGLEELAGPGQALAIEWPDRLGGPVAGALEVRFVDAGEDAREITIGGQQTVAGAHSSL